MEPPWYYTFNILSEEFLVVEPEKGLELSPGLHAYYKLVLEPHFIKETPG